MKVAEERDDLAQSVRIVLFSIFLYSLSSSFTADKTCNELACPFYQEDETDLMTASVREYVFYVFFSDFKKHDFLRFWNDLSKKRKKSLAKI